MDPNPIKKIHQFISFFPVRERTNNITGIIGDLTAKAIRNPI